jgi:hypothetical protein
VVRWWVEIATVFDARALHPRRVGHTPLKNPVQNPRRFRTSGRDFRHGHGTAITLGDTRVATTTPK